MAISKKAVGLLLTGCLVSTLLTSTPAPAHAYWGQGFVECVSDVATGVIKGEASRGVSPWQINTAGKAAIGIGYDAKMLQLNKKMNDAASNGDWDEVDRIQKQVTKLQKFGPAVIKTLED